MVSILYIYLCHKQKQDIMKNFKMSIARVRVIKRLKSLGLENDCVRSVVNSKAGNSMILEELPKVF